MPKARSQGTGVRIRRYAVMETLKTGFVGAGFVANFHATALKLVRGV